MKTVILYGIRGTGRKEIEFFLSNAYEIIGYSDSDEFYSNYRYIDYIRYFKPEELSGVKFDYIIITSKKIEVSNEIRQKIIQEGGTKKEKILQYALFSEVEYPHPYEVFQTISLQFRGLVLGMSHAQKGININMFKEHIFNFAFGSNDLFDTYHLLNKVYKENKKFFNVKYCILELPYYIFNWDRSKSRSALRRMNSYVVMDGEENQYHNLETYDGDLIYQYQIYEKMFKEKKLYNKSVRNAGVYDIPNVTAYQDYVEISNIWNMQHKDTIEENIIYFKQIISLLNQMNSEIKIYITIFPQNPRFYHMHEKVIEEAKTQFYKMINDNLSANVVVLDYFTLYDEKENYFMDDCHLNTLGRNMFSRELAKKIGESIG